MTHTILRVTEVEKQFESIRAVDRLSFRVQRGEIFALLGPNGAGKTTMVRMLMGILRPDRGSIEFALSADAPAWPAPVQLGYLPEDRGLYRELPVMKTLTYFGVLRGLPRREAALAAEKWLERLGLRDRSGDKLESLSKGNQQKVQFIASILHQPLFAALDEPFSGLDPVNQNVFLELIRDLRNAGMTILLSSHQMQLVERIADTILLMSEGREVLSGALKDIRRRSPAGSKIILKVRGTPDLGVFRDLKSVAQVSSDAAGEVTLFLQERESLSELLVSAGSALDITDIRSDEIDLHDIYVQAVSSDSGSEEEGR